MTDTKIKLIQPNEIQNKNLPPIQQAALLMTLNTVLAGHGDVSVSFTYDKQTTAKPRKAGVDYVEMPGVAANAFFGKIAKVARGKKTGQVYFLLNALSRGTGTTPSQPTNIKPEGITMFAVTGFVPNDSIGQED